MVPFSLEDTSSFKQIAQMWKCALLKKAGVFIVLPLTHDKKKINK